MRLISTELRQLGLFIGLLLPLAGIVPLATPAKAAVVAAAGDVACDPTDPNFSGNKATACKFRDTANLISSDASISQVLALGDLQYNDGSLDDFQFAYDPTWGAFKGKTQPVPGDEEYVTPNAQGYFDYFGAAAHGPNGYYSYNLGNWHIVALNSNCGEVGGCAAGSPQEVWLKNDLAADNSACTLAFAHHPRFSSSGSTTAISPLVKALFNDGAEILLGGNRHNYERFGPQNFSGKANANGIVQFVVGTGGKSLASFGSTKANSLAQLRAFGILRLSLNSNGYTWKFVRTTGSSFDSGSATCH